jgi:hypothetical protein
MTVMPKSGVNRDYYIREQQTQIEAGNNSWEQPNNPNQQLIKIARGIEKADKKVAPKRLESLLPTSALGLKRKVGDTTAVEDTDFSSSTQMSADISSRPIIPLPPGMGNDESTAKQIPHGFVVASDVASRLAEQKAKQSTTKPLPPRPQAPPPEWAKRKKKVI